MFTYESPNSEELWKRVGLHELRDTLEQVTILMNRFEQALQALPPCNHCAQAALLEQVHRTGNQLSGQVVSLTVLAETLKQAVAVSERAHEMLSASQLTPCRCPSGPCTCHEQRL